LISKTIIKFHILRFLREYSKVGFYLGAFVISFVLFAFSHHYPEIESFEKFVFKRTFLFNTFICLVLSAGILGREISDGFMNVLLSKPVKKHTIYFSKFTATLLFSCTLLILFLICIGLMFMFSPDKNFPFMPLITVFFFLLIDQISLIAMSTFISAWTPREMNITIIVFILIALFFIPILLGPNFSPMMKQIFNFVNPIKSIISINNFFAAKMNWLIFMLSFIVYLVTLSAAGMVIFNNKEIRR
jgi:ABC-type transport system involved in multi-copper enzyme maturation permease subunit